MMRFSKREESKNIVISLFKNDKLSLEEIAEVAEISLEEVKKIVQH